MILDTIVADKKKRLIEHKKKFSEIDMKKMAQESKRVSYSFYQALKKEGLSIIGEFKQASPSMGIIKNKLNLEDRIKQYNQSVDAISCLTEEDHFYGNIEYFKKIRKMSILPMIRKDFIIDTYQVYEAKVIGADAILLIAAILEDNKMKELYELSYQLGMDVLLEVHDEAELLRAMKLGAKIIGVNNRNLKDFTIELETTKRLVTYLDYNIDKHANNEQHAIQTAPMLNKNSQENRPVFVSESGVTTKEDIQFLKNLQVDALLIGRAFMESESPEELAKEWKQIYSN